MLARWISTVLPVIAMAMPASAEALTWEPQNTDQNVTAFNTFTLTENTGPEIRCSGFTSQVRATGTVQLSRNTPPATLTGCTNTLVPFLTTTVTTGGVFHYTATATNTVELLMINPGTDVMTATIAGFCTIHVPSTGTGVTIGQNVWSNISSRFALNGGVTFGISETGAGCSGGTTADLTGTLQLPAMTTIN